MDTRLWNSVSVAAIAACSLFTTGCQREPETQAQAPAPTTALPKREAIFFIKGDATLSPGAVVKLRTWVEAWGAGGRWMLACPSGPGLTYDLLERRLQAIRAELGRLGVAKVETILLPSEPSGQYDAIYIMKGPA